jgi:membrane protein
VARMKLLRRDRGGTESDDDRDDRPQADEAPEPLPEPEEPRLEDPGSAHLSIRDYFAVLRRAIKEFMHDHMTDVAAALAYYAFLAIPSSLLVAVGIFSLVGDQNAVTTVIDKLHGIAPEQATSLIEGSLRNIVNSHSTGITVLSIGGVLAFWSLTGAMQTLMWALNIAYEQEEGRGFVHRRIVALWMVLFALIGFALAFGVLVLGPQISTWIGNAIGARSATKAVWYIAEWPLLIGGLLFVFAACRYYGPDVKHPQWRFLTFGAIVALVIWLLASGAFAYYTSRFSSYNKTWGSLAAVVVMLTWLWISSVALLLGAEVDAETDRTRELQAPAKA